MRDKGGSEEESRESERGKEENENEGETIRNETSKKERMHRIGKGRGGEGVCRKGKRGEERKGEGGTIGKYVKWAARESTLT